jgi:hypothetical protein
VAAYVWDYVGGMQMMRHFWDAAPTYLASVGDDVRERIRLCLESRLTPARGGPIELTARAWAVRGIA